MPSPISLHRIRQSLSQTRHRALVILSGSPAWQIQQLRTLWQPEESVLWAGQFPEGFSSSVQAVKESQYKHLLGQEVDSVVIDTSTGFSANGLGILSGLIRAGGLLVLLTADKSNWTGLVNPENQRFLSTPYSPEDALPFFSEHLASIFENQALWFSEQQSEQASADIIEAFIATQSKTAVTQTLPTADQQTALQQIHKVAFGHRKRPLVISADRGRGKTSVLGLAAIELLTQGKQHIVLTASRYDQAQMAFEQACSILEMHLHTISKDNTDAFQILTNKTGLLKFKWQNQLKTFEFIAPDQLVLQPTLADVLMVDEAAHLPTPLLTELLKRHHRMVFATTLHGYEGSGRGFELRFKKTLTELTPNWKSTHLTTPIRWADKDPLESVINTALLLNHEENQTEHTPQEGIKAWLEPISNEEPSQLNIEAITTEAIAHDTATLYAVFNLLVQAHYQTSPNDLQQLLSAPNLKIIIARSKSQIVGVVLCIEEGKIHADKQRLHGHLVPQLLKNHYTQASFLLLSTWRIMRIAVHPQIQNSGIGKQLLAAIKNMAKQARIDYLSSSFGATDELLSFWFKQGYIPLHVGVKRDKASGSHTVVVCQSLSPMAQQALACIQRAFQAQFPHVLMESLPYFSASMVLSILKTFRFKQQRPHLQEALLNYKTDIRAYETVSGQMWEWSIRNPLAIGRARASQQAIWVDKVLKKLNWQEVAHIHHLAGRKAVENALKESVSELIKNPSKSISPYARVPNAF